MLDVLIIGSGPAGYTAAIYAGRAGRNVQIVIGPQEGGQLMITTSIENYPGFISPFNSIELMANMKSQAESVGAKFANDAITSVDFSTIGHFKCIGEAGAVYESKSVIIATGANAKWLGISGEQKYKGVGVSACATCDGFFFRNKVVAVIGGGNTAVEDAIFLSNFASKVFLIHRKDSLKAENLMQQKLFANPKIEIIWNVNVVDILGDERKVTELLLQNSQNHQRSNINVDGVFIAIGHAPVTEIFKNTLKINDGGYISVNNFVHTSVEGVFAAGDVSDPIYRQAITSSGFGCIAAIEADKFLSTN